MWRCTQRSNTRPAMDWACTLCLAGLCTSVLCSTAEVLVSMLQPAPLAWWQQGKLDTRPKQAHSQAVLGRNWCHQC